MVFPSLESEVKTPPLNVIQLFLFQLDNETLFCGLSVLEAAKELLIENVRSGTLSGLGVIFILNLTFIFNDIGNYTKKTFY